MYLLVFFFNDTATTEIYTLSLHDALPILSLASSPSCPVQAFRVRTRVYATQFHPELDLAGLATRIQVYRQDRKSTRLNSSHANISYAVFCLKKKKKNKITSYSYTSRYNSI